MLHSSAGGKNRLKPNWQAISGLGMLLRQKLKKTLCVGKIASAQAYAIDFIDFGHVFAQN